MHFHLKLPYELVTHQDLKSAAQFRRPVVTVYDNPDVPMGDMRIVRPQGYERVQGLLVALLGEQKPVVVFVNPDQWDTTVYLFKQAGYEVTNDEAPFTPIPARSL